MRLSGRSPALLNPKDFKQDLPVGFRRMPNVEERQRAQDTIRTESKSPGIRILQHRRCLLAPLADEARGLCPRNLADIIERDERERRTLARLVEQERS
jgi:hypothetical protein